MQFVVFSLALLGLVSSAVMLLWTAFALCLVKRAYHRPAPNPDPAPCPADICPKVVMLRPLKGLDGGLWQNLHSALALKYPLGKLSIVLSVDSESDPALSVAQQLVEFVRQNPRKYPSIELIIGDERVGINPKINNLIRGYCAADPDCIIWICDSNVRLEPDVLQVAISLFLGDPQVGLVHHAPQGIQADQLGAKLEQCFLNTAHTKIYVVINWTALDSCIMGKSILFRKQDLEQCGGLGAFGAQIAEDNAIGVALMRLGFKHALSTKPALQPLTGFSVRGYLQRRSRWTRIRVHAVPGATAVEPLTECIMSAAIGAWSVSYIFGTPFWMYFFAHVAYWFIMDFLMVRSFTGTSVPFIDFTSTWILREVSALPIYIYSLIFCSYVNWRGNPFRFTSSGVIDASVQKQVD